MIGKESIFAGFVQRFPLVTTSARGHLWRPEKHSLRWRKWTIGKRHHRAGRSRTRFITRHPRSRGDLLIPAIPSPRLGDETLKVVQPGRTMLAQSWLSKCV